MGFDCINSLSLSFYLLCIKWNLYVSETADQFFRFPLIVQIRDKIVERLFVSSL